MESKVGIDRLRLGPLDNNVWFVGDDQEVVVIDAAHDARIITRRIDNRQVKAILITHGHFDHIDAARNLKAKVGAPVYLHSDDHFLWQEQHPNTTPDSQLHDNEKLTVANITIKALHTPGHTPGSTCYYVPELGVVFTGDTLFPGGPGATRWGYSNSKTIIDSITYKLFTLPDSTQVLPGHGEPTTIAAEKPVIEGFRSA